MAFFNLITRSSNSKLIPLGVIAGLLYRARMIRAGRRQYGPLSMAPSKARVHSRDVPYCRVPYDDEHIRTYGYNCTNRHRLYSWPALSEEKYLLIGDSLVKYVNRAKHLRVVAGPGARAHDTIMKVGAGKIPVDGFSLVIVATGTNDVSDVTMPVKLVAQGIVMLMARIEAINPTAVMMFSGLLVRPKDLGGEIEYRRKIVNKLVFEMCNERDISPLNIGAA